MTPIIWLTGQPGSGKTTLANELAKLLQTQYMTYEEREAVVVDGDDLRNILGNPGYGPAARMQNIRNAQNIAKFLTAKRYNVIVSLVSPYREQREEFKKENKIIEVYCHTTEKRGREKFFVEDYQAPETDFLDMDTGAKTIKECVSEIFDVYWKMATVP